MKKVFMSLAIVAAMFAAASCACNNTPKEAEAPCCEQTECCDSTKCSDCTECCDSTKCAGCDSTATDCCKAE